MDFSTLTTSDVLQAAIALFTLSGVMVTGLMLWRQIGKATHANELTAAAIEAGIIIKYDEMFFQKRVRQCRIMASKFLLEHRNLPVTEETVNQWDVVSDLLDFFQGLATFTRAHSLSTDLVYKN